MRLCRTPIPPDMMAFATTRALFTRGWIALGIVGMDPVLIGGYLVLLARGTTNYCARGKHSRMTTALVRWTRKATAALPQ
ncbi:unnamed protein product [Ectocarpus sp. 12 AP-2014]